MAEPFSVGTGILGVLSLGIQVTQNLVDYYVSFKGRDAYINRTLQNLEHLQTTFQSLRSALNQRKFSQDEASPTDQIKQSLGCCEIIVDELQEEAQKIKHSLKGGLKNSVQNAARRVAYPFRESTLKKLNEDIQEIQQNLSLALDVLQLTDSSHIRKDVDEINALLNLVRSSQISDKLSSWLKAPDATVNHHEACAKRNPGSGLWLLQHPDFIAWLDTSTESSFAWIHGFAGCGKSVLCSTAIQHTFAHRNSNPNIGIAFFYFSFNDESKQNVSNMLRALVLQLSNQLPDGQSYLEYLKKSSSDASPSLKGLTDTLKEMTQKFQSVYLVIDALDESQPDERNVLCQTIKSLLKHSHILVTSRDMPDIRERIQFLGVNISLKNDEVDKDISDFIARYLEEDISLRKWSTYHDEIKESLSHRANGVFRWVECQFRSLTRCPRSKAALERCLASLPESLDETYERMLLNIDSNCREEAKRVFTLLCYAPRLLTVAEVIDGITVQLGETPCVNLDRRVSDEDDVLQICPGFIDLSYTSKDSTPRLRIAHFSVQEYLESERILQQRAAGYGLSKCKAHAQLAEICLVYLLDPFFSKPQRSEMVHLDRPFGHLAAAYWPHYYRESQNAAAASNAESLIMDLFLNRLENFRNWVRLYSVDHFHEIRYHGDLIWSPRSTFIKPRILHASSLGLAFMIPHLSFKDDLFPGPNYRARALREASSKGYLGVVELLLDKGVDPNSRESNEEGALEDASSNGHHKVVTLLLQKGAKVNAEGFRFGTALAAASGSGHSKLVQLLLDKGADVNIRDLYSNTALSEAALHGYADIVKVLLKYGAKVNFQNTYSRALFSAAYGGHKDIVELLLDNGADVNTYNDLQTKITIHLGYQHEYSALHTAACRGRPEIVQLLLNRGAQVNATNRIDSNALFLALSRGHYETVQLLLSNGATFQMEGKNFYTALEAAAFRGCQDIIELLLNNNALTDSNVHGRGYGTALQQASLQGYRKIAQLLLDAGADVNANTEPYGSPLIAASQHGHLNLVQLLINSGANLNASGRNYGNALIAASFEGHEQVAQILLDSGANVNASEGEYDNALLAASFEGHEQVVQLLLDSGANVNARGGTYGTALQVASFWGHKKLVQVLLDAGAIINARGEDGEPEFNALRAGGPMKHGFCGNRLNRHGIYYGTALQIASYHGYKDIVDLLLDKDADVNAGSKLYGSALQAAMYGEEEDIAQLLLDRGSDVNIYGGALGSALQAASANGKQRIVKILVNRGADVNLRGGKYNTALQAAASQGYKDLVEFLIDNGADINASGEQPGNALEASASEGFTELVKLLIKRGANVNVDILGRIYLSHEALEESHSEVVRLLLDKGAHVNACKTLNGTALQAAICRGNHEIIQMLLDSGADVNIQRGMFGSTALELAAHRGDLELVRLLLDKGADIHASGSGIQPLTAACCSGDEEIVKLLLDSSADVNGQQWNRGVGIRIACSYGHREITKLLLERGADINAQDKRYGSALQAAVIGGSREVVDLLLDEGAEVNDSGGEYGSALQAAISNGYEYLAQLLLDRGANNNALKRDDQSEENGRVTTIN